MERLTVHFFTSYVHEQGTYFRSHNLAVGLTQLGHDVTVFGCDLDWKSAARTEHREGVRYEIVPESWKTSIFSQFNHPWTTARRYLRRYPPCDIAHLFQPFLGAAAAWLRSPARGNIYDWDDRWTGGLTKGPVQSWRERWPRFITWQMEERLPPAAHVTVVGDYLGQMARERGAPAVSVVYNGYWPTPVADRQAARTRLGLRTDAMYVGFMGRTVAELQWCFDAVAKALDAHLTLRFALCGSPESVLAELPASLRNRIDYLGHLSAAQCRDFAAGIDLGLLPLADDAFNQSRYPIKFCDHLATGNPLLCSEVGEVGRLAKLFPWAILAGTTRAEWMQAFAVAVDQLSKGIRPAAELGLLAEKLSWRVLSQQLLDTYSATLAAASTKPV